MEVNMRKLEKHATYTIEEKNEIVKNTKNTEWF